MDLTPLLYLIIGILCLYIYRRMKDRWSGK